MTFEEVKARCETLKLKVLTWSKELEEVNEWDLNDLNSVLYNVNKVIKDALADEKLNELFNFPLASCEVFIRAVRRYDLTCSDLSKALNSLVFVIDATVEKLIINDTIEKVKEENEIVKLKQMFTECAKKEDNEETKAVLLACVDHADKIFDVIY